MPLVGVDIYDGEASIDLAATGADFVIIKATQGDWQQEHWRESVAKAQAGGILFGLYHFPEVDKGVDVEVSTFLSTVKDFIGQAPLFLDWENNEVTGQKNLDAGVGYAKKFLDEVKARTGVTPLIYTSKSVTNEYDWSPVSSEGIGLWGSQYLNKYYDGSVHDLLDAPEMRSGWGAFVAPVIYQYTGNGHINGFDGDLDLDVAYMSREDWLKAATCGKQGGSTMPSIQKFVARMRYWCDEANLGYDQSNREDFEVGGETDCSALVIHCLQEAGFDTGEATYTGNMSDELCARGWERVSNDGNPQFGDILLNDSHHVAVYVGGGLLSQASHGEPGHRVRGGQSGDQTDDETITKAYYDFPWSCYLRYTGATSDEGGSSTDGRSVDELAQAVINGEFGDGDSRRTALGDQYEAVQARVNEILGGGPSPSVSADIDQLAQDVIDGKYGNGDDRRNALGANYDAVQARVNELLNGGSSDDIDALAQDVIDGKYGNGDDRKAALGSNYDAVQARVNEILG